MEDKSNNIELKNSQVGFIIESGGKQEIGRDLNVYIGHDARNACPTCRNAATKFSVITSIPQHKLAYTLAAPKEPLPPQKPKKVAPISTIITESSGGGFMIIWGFIILAAIVAGVIALTEYRSGQLIGIAVLIIVLIGLVSGAIISSTNTTSSSASTSTEVKRANEHYKSLLQVYQTIEYPRWKKAYEVWKSLYYCGHCGAIYREEDKAIVGVINDIPTIYYRQ
jgi:hypothetical protein